MIRVEAWAGTAILLTIAAPCGAEEWPLERLYQRPYIWGTAPQDVKWSKQGHTLVFLWNADGNRFLDLYSYHPERRNLIRLTDLSFFKDELLFSDAEKDERRKLYVEPPAGIGEFDISRDGSLVAFSYRGELFTVKSDGAAPPLRLTRTKAIESSPQLSQDARKLASVRDEQVVVQDLTNGQLWQVTDVERPESTLESHQWSPDGRHFAYVVRRGKLREMPLPIYSGRIVTAGMFYADAGGGRPTGAPSIHHSGRGRQTTECRYGAIEGKRLSKRAEMV